MHLEPEKSKVVADLRNMTVLIFTGASSKLERQSVAPRRTNARTMSLVFGGGDWDDMTLVSLHHKRAFFGILSLFCFQFPWDRGRQRLRSRRRRAKAPRRALCSPPSRSDRRPTCSCPSAAPSPKAVPTR